MFSIRNEEKNVIIPLIMQDSLKFLHLITLIETECLPLGCEGYSCERYGHVKGVLVSMTA